MTEEKYQVKDMGTYMPQGEYEELLKAVYEDGKAPLSPDEAAMFLERNLGFIGSRVQIINVAEDYYVKEPDSKLFRIICKWNIYKNREPLYYSSDWNYIRFQVSGYDYELVNGELYRYIT